MKGTWRYKVKKLSDFEAIEFQGMKVNPLIKKSETGQMSAYHILIPKRTRIPPSYHKKAHEIIFVLSGRGKVHLNRRNIHIKKGDVILVQPRTWHSFSTARHTLKVLAVPSPYVDSKTDLYHE